VATCPTGALMFGERDELLKYAHDRLTAQPARYLNHVYGESENGGTSYLILSHVPFKELGLPELPSSPVKDISEAVMRLTLPSALGVGAVLTGLAVGVHMVNQKEEADAKKADHSESSAQETK